MNSRYFFTCKTDLFIVLLAKHTLGRPTGRYRRRWEDNIRIYFNLLSHELISRHAVSIIVSRTEHIMV